MIWKCVCAYIGQNLLEDTRTASALTSLICILLQVKAICIGAESVLQNCVIGDVLLCILLHTSYLVVNVVFMISFSATGTWLYADRISHG